MRGIYWRKAKLEAIHKAGVKGYSEDDILRLLIRGGLTVRQLRGLWMIQERFIERMNKFEA
jgi:hypothetical protein